MLFLPAHDEVAVASIASGVAHSEDEGLAVTIPLAGELVGVPDDLEED